MRRVLLLTATLVLGATPPGPAAAAPPADAQGTLQEAAARQGTAARQATAAERRAARRAEALARRSAELTAAVPVAADRLARAFADGARAQSDRDAAARRLTRARSVRTAGARELYLRGSAGLTLTVLEADSVEDALWRLDTARRVTDAVLRRASGEAAAASDAVGDATAAAETADATETLLTRRLEELRERATVADGALAAARHDLRRLSARARRLAAAERAARTLAAAQQAAQQATHRAAAARAASVTPSTGALGVPAEYERIYRDAAATCPGMSWTLLAAVGQVESGHGRTNGPSSAGAVGPMQFMPATFAAYAVDGNGDGLRDAWDVHDAVPTAARYLCASGARGGSAAGVRRALLAYNHAGWYVDLVLTAQQALDLAERQTPAPF